MQLGQTEPVSTSAFRTIFRRPRPAPVGIHAESESSCEKSIPAVVAPTGVAAINAGLDNPYRICKETGRGEYEENIDQIARAREYAESRGVPLNYVMQPVETVADDTQDRNTRGRA